MFVLGSVSWKMFFLFYFLCPLLFSSNWGIRYIYIDHQFIVFFDFLLVGSAQQTPFPNISSFDLASQLFGGNLGCYSKNFSYPKHGLTCNPLGGSSPGLGSAVRITPPFLSHKTAIWKGVRVTMITNHLQGLGWSSTRADMYGCIPLQKIPPGEWVVMMLLLGMPKDSPVPKIHGTGIFTYMYHLN